MSTSTSTTHSTLPSPTTVSPSTLSTSFASISSHSSAGGKDLTSTLPPVVWRTLIGSWLSVPDLIVISSVSKYLRHIFRGSSSRAMWRSRILRMYPGIPVCPPAVVEPCLITRIEDLVCLACGTNVGGELVPYLVGCWCLACKDKKFINNSTIKVDEVRMILPRTKMTPRVCIEYSLSQDAKEGEKLYHARLNSESDGAKWKEWKEKQRSLRKFGDRLAGYLGRLRAKTKTLAALFTPTPDPASLDRASSTVSTSQLGILSRLGRVKELRKSSVNVRHSIDKEGKKPVPASGVPAGTYVYKSDLDLVQGKQEPLTVSVLAPPELLEN